MSDILTIFSLVVIVGIGLYVIHKSNLNVPPNHFIDGDNDGGEDGD